MFLSIPRLSFRCEQYENENKDEGLGKVRALASNEGREISIFISG
jgi:hypothetical protein